jgi:hypothetical protein
LIQAFYAGESAEAVPVDQIILRPKQPAASLMLPEGTFLVRAMDKSGNVLSEYQKTETSESEKSRFNASRRRFSYSGDQ